MSSIPNQGSQSQLQPQQRQTSNVSGAGGAPLAQTSNILTPVELNHQTFQAWIDSLVDPSVSEDIKIRTVQDLSLHLEVLVHLI